MDNFKDDFYEAVSTLIDISNAQLKFDKTVKATVWKVVDVDSGEYRVRYNGNIFLAYSLDKTYEEDDEVYVLVPEGDFSNRKIITGTATKQSLSQQEITNLQNTIFYISPEFSVLYKDNEGKSLYDPDGTETDENGNIKYKYGVIAGAPEDEEGKGYIYIYKGSDGYNPDDPHGQFQQYASKYTSIEIKGSFLTQLQSPHIKGNYGLEVEFYTKGDPIRYRLDINSFNGAPYSFNTPSPQSIIIETTKDYLTGLKSIKLFQENFEYDRIYENGAVTAKENKTVANIFVKDISLRYVEKKDLSDTNYYLTIEASKGIAFTSNSHSLDLVARLYYQGRDLSDPNTCTYQWFERDLSVFVGHELYNKDAGFGWKPMEETGNVVELIDTDVIYQKDYKLILTYNNKVTLTAETTIFNQNNKYEYHIEQVTEDDKIYLRLVNDYDNKQLRANWYYSYPDLSYREVTGNPQPQIEVSDLLLYPTVTFYAAVYAYNSTTEIAGTISHKIQDTTAISDLSISYEGEDAFRYDANGDVTIEDSERERILKAFLTWKDGVGTAYTLEWCMRDADGNLIVLTDKETKPSNSMIEKVWVDNYRILHYNIKQKYRLNYTNNTILIRVTTLTDTVYLFEKEIIFLKDGDQGTNGTTYVAAIRPCDNNGIKKSGLNPLVYNSGKWQGSLPLKCYIYKDGELIEQDPASYSFDIEWSGVNININSFPSDKARVIVTGQGNITSTSNSKELEHYIKAWVTITDKTAGKSIQIYCTYPIDLALENINYAAIDIDDIPSYIKYNSSGESPIFYNSPIHYYYNGVLKNELINPLNKKVLDVTPPYTEGGDYRLRPASQFIFDNQKDNNGESNIGILEFRDPDNASRRYIHPVMMYLDNYGNEYINGWDGTALEIDENKHYVFAPIVGAGKKEEGNRFTGVVMGDDSVQEQVGLYGYQKGTTTFGLRTDGTAFFGATKDGGRIDFDGTSATIVGGGGGDKITGMTITLADLRDPNLSNDKKSKTEAIKLGAGNFVVTYGGKVTANEADIKGEIYAESGRIGGTSRGSGGWVITKNRISSDNGSGSYVGLDSSRSSDDDYIEYAIWAGDSNPENAEFSVTKKGVVKATSATITGNITAKTLSASESGEIGGWTIDKKRLYSGSGDSHVELNASDTSKSSYVFWAGADAGKDAKFSVQRDGTVNATNATISGTITAGNGGKIGSWEIKDGNLQSSDNKIILNPTDGINVNSKSFYVDLQGNVSMKTGAKLTIGDNFSVDENGTITLKGNINMSSGNITWSSSNTPVQYKYSPTNKSSDFHDPPMLDTDKYRKDSLDGGTTWGPAYQFRGEDGKDGQNGSNANVTWDSVKSALQTASSTKKTFITADSTGSPTIYGGKIYGSEIYAGGANDEGGRIIGLTKEGAEFYDGSSGTRLLKISTYSGATGSGAKITTSDAQTLFIQGGEYLILRGGAVGVQLQGYVSFSQNTLVDFTGAVVEGLPSVVAVFG